MKGTVAIKLRGKKKVVLSMIRCCQHRQGAEGIAQQYVSIHRKQEKNGGVSIISCARRLESTPRHIRPVIVFDIWVQDSIVRFICQ